MPEVRAVSQVPLNDRASLPNTLRSFLTWFSRAATAAPTSTTSATTNAQMGPITMPTAAQHAEASDATASSGTVQDGFEKLLAAVNPYVDELTHQPNFPLFMNLPIELRCLVYEQHFMDETRSIACRNWPYLKFSQAYVASIMQKRKTAPFLPDLCLTSKALRSELFSSLLETAHFEFDDCVAFGRVLILLHGSPMSLTQTVRKATMKNVNGQRKRLLFTSPNDKAQEDARELASRSNGLHGVATPYLSRLRELSLTFYTPLLYMGPFWISRRQESIQALPMKDYLAGLELESIFGLRELKKISIIGYSGGCNKTDQVTRHGNPIIDERKADHSAAILDLARQIMEGFKVRGRHVAVTAHLKYVEGDHAQELVR